MVKIVEVLAAAKKAIGNSPAEARRIILDAGELDPKSEHFIPIQQILARSIYKDEDLLAPQKFESALQVLETHCVLDCSTDGETLGLAGACYKRMWDYTGQRTHLEKALKWYARGREVAPDADGWLAVNTAFVSDVLGVQEGRIGDAEAVARRTARFAYADQIRTEVLGRLNAAGPPKLGNAWYHHASRAEAAFGLGNFQAAAAALDEGRGAIASMPKERAPQETTARQLALLAHLRFEGTPQFETASNVIQQAFGINDHAVHALFGGKIGLALSGGGFRASLFHIGVLAKLAELDLLRHVEVISCVSGGSIIGAFYYLELKKLLESGKTTHADYLQMVRDVETKFLAGVQKNVRTRILASPLAGLKMALASGYSRSDVIASLYQEHFYDQTAAEGKEPARVMTDLMVQPAEFSGAPGDFNPKYDNWRLSAKVPMLVLNATTMNTGHNWQFTATWMGESPQAISATIDAVPRYRRMRYDEAPEAHQRIPIGRAVGASACVPALFEPIVLRNLYPDRTVRLVDGGVHDNQGLSSLLEQNCLVILASDASGQFQEKPSPGGSVSDSLGNSNGVLQSRVREAQFDQLSALRRGGAIQGAMFIHLTKDLDAEPVSWIGEAPKPARKPPATTSYGIDRKIQLKLAEVRTDLDSFSDAEGYALMTSGYRMTERALLAEKCVPTLQPAGSRQPWQFLAAEDALTRADQKQTDRMLTLLSVSNELAGKVWKQLAPLKALAWVLRLGAIAGVVYTLWETRKLKLELPPLGMILLIALGLLLAKVALTQLDKRRLYHKRLGEMGLGFGITFAGWIVGGLHLLLFDRLFLRHGKWSAAPRPNGAAIVDSGAKLPVVGNAQPGDAGSADVVSHVEAGGELPHDRRM
jgi:predicted acylesterase/phospholipase RssA